MTNNYEQLKATRDRLLEAHKAYYARFNKYDHIMRLNLINARREMRKVQFGVMVD